MKSITELIEELEEIKKNEGDLEVFYWGEHGEAEELELDFHTIFGVKVLLVRY